MSKLDPWAIGFMSFLERKRPTIFAVLNTADEIYPSNNNLIAKFKNKKHFGFKILNDEKIKSEIMSLIHQFIKDCPTGFIVK